jgi:prepilin-type processing-associated H-X9-DG protein
VYRANHRFSWNDAIIPKGGHFLFTDGHVKWGKVSSAWPTAVYTNTWYGEILVGSGSKGKATEP